MPARAHGQRSTKGAALLEAIVALALVGSVGTALMGELVVAQHAVRGVRGRERELLQADRIMTAMTLLRADDLDRRLGERDVAGWTISVQRPRRGLYRIAVNGRYEPHGEVLVTVVHRQ